MPAIPKPTKKKKRKKRRPNNLEKYPCPICEEEFFQDTLAAKKAILVHLHSEVCKQRDHYTCQYCGSKQNLVVHHIFGQKAYPAGKWVVANGVTICVKDHLPIAHRKPEQFRRWVIRDICEREHVPLSMAEDVYDWLFAHVQEVKQFRAKDFEKERTELENMLVMG